MKLASLSGIIKKHPFIAPAITFIVLYVFHFWATLLHGDVLYGGPGDHIAGIIWLFDRLPQTPWWGHTDLAAFPWGDNLWSPLFIMGQIGYIVYWGCAKLLGSVAGYNLFTFIGFAASFIVSYLFLYHRVIKRPIFASLFAALITFTPYVLFLDGVGHASYIYLPAYCIAAIWCVLCIFESGGWKPVVLLGSLVGLTVVFDPYFVLFVPLAIAAFAAGLLLVKYGTAHKQSLKQITLRFIAAAAVGALLASPALLYLRKHAGQVNATASVTRNAMVHDADSYSAHLSDYFLPSKTNPLAPQFIKDVKAGSFHGSDPTFTTFLGYTPLVGSVCAAIYWVRTKASKKDLRNGRKVSAAFVCMAAAAFLFSLPPTLHVLGIEVYMPTWFVVHVTSAWRVFARLYIIVQLGMVIVLAYAANEWLLARSKKISLPTKQILIVACCLFVLFVEYLPRNPFDQSLYWSFSHDLPKSYAAVKSDDDIDVLAEYPLREQPYYQGSLYIAGQHVHGKATFNAYSPTSASTYYRQSLMDLGGPQTIPVLRFLGVNGLLVWNNDLQDWRPVAGLTEVSSERYKSRFGADELRLYRIDASGPQHRYAVILNQDFRPGSDKQIYGLPTPISNGVSMDIDDLCKIIKDKPDCKRPDNETTRFSTSIVNTSSQAIELTISGDNSLKVIQKVQPGTSTITADLPSGRYVINYDETFNGHVMLSNFQALAGK